MKWGAYIKEIGVMGSRQEVGVIVAITLHPETAGLHRLANSLPADGPAKLARATHPGLEGAVAVP